MALLADVHSMDVNVHPSDDGTAWSSICSDIFDAYLGEADPCGLDVEHPKDSSLIDFRNLFDYTTCEDRYSQPSGTRDIAPRRNYSFQDHESVTRQSDSYWSKMLPTLEQKTNEFGHEKKLYATAKDFLSLDGFPSSPALPASPMVHPISGQSEQSQPSGRPTNADGVYLPPAQRFSSLSPSSAQLSQDANVRSFDDLPGPTNLAASDELGVECDNIAAASYGQQLSPLARSLQQTHLHSAFHIPRPAQVTKFDDTFFHVPQLPPTQSCSMQTMKDIAPFVVPAQTPDVANCEFTTFDFGIDQCHQDSSAFALSPMDEHYPLKSYDATEFCCHRSFNGMDSTILETTENHDCVSSMAIDEGLGINDENPGLTPAEVSGLSLGYATMSEHTVTPTKTPFAAASHSQSLPFHLRLHRRLDTDHPNSQRNYSNAMLRSHSPPSPSIAAFAQRARSSRRNTSHNRRRTESTGYTSRHAGPEQEIGDNTFVNYTPQDHGKLLSGVAPSGSSKTKARRDREMEVKRGRISQGGVRAVVEAGRDLERLRGEKLLV